MMLFCVQLYDTLLLLVTKYTWKYYETQHHNQTPIEGCAGNFNIFLQYLHVAGI